MALKLIENEQKKSPSVTILVFNLSVVIARLLLEGGLIDITKHKPAPKPFPQSV